MRALIAAVAIFCAGLFITAQAQDTCIGCGIYGMYKSAASCGGSTPTIDTHGQGSTVSSGTTATVSVSTNAADVILIFAELNSSTTNLSGTISGGAGVTWGNSGNPRATSWSTANSGANTNPILEFYGITSGSISNQTATVTAGGTLSYGVIGYVSISGANLTSPFDPNSSIPATISGSATDPISFMTTCTKTMAVAGFRIITASPGSGSGWTDLVGANYQLIESQSGNFTGGGSATVGTGAGEANGGMVDAIHS